MPIERPRKERSVAGSGQAFPFAYHDLLEHPRMKEVLEGVRRKGSATLFEGGIGFAETASNLGIAHVMNAIGKENIKKAYWFEPNGMEHDFAKMALEMGSLKELSDKVELSPGNVFSDAPPEGCDLVFSHMVMPHFTPEEREEFFGRLVGMAKDGGHLFVDVLPPFDNGHVKHEIYNKKNALEPADVGDSLPALQKMGLELVGASKFFFILRKKA